MDSPGPRPWWQEYFSYAATGYTTVGFSDLLPQAGPVMITWSASLTFIEMQRARRREEDSTRPAGAADLAGETRD